MRLSLALTSLLISLTSHAAPIVAPSKSSLQNCGLTAKGVSFLPAEEAFKDMREMLPIMASNATLKLGPSRCSANYISDQGHLLLASHCLEKCTVGMSGTERTCEGSIDGKPTKFHVEVMSKCAANADLGVQLAKSQSREIPAALSHCGEAGDLAIVRAETTPTEFKCLGLASKRPELGESIFNIGTPQKTSRTNSKWNADGDSKYVSKGEVIQRRTCQHQGRTPSLAEKFFEGQKDVAPHEVDMGEVGDYLSKRMIQITAGAVQSSSGGPLVNRRGEIIGVTSRVDTRNDERNECVGGVYSEPITNLDATIKAWKPSAKAADFTSCNKRRFTPGSTSASSI